VSRLGGLRAPSGAIDPLIGSAMSAHDARDHVDVISVGGASRSGSTLLALLLGRLEGFFVAGELRYVWSRGFLQNELCGCGTPFRDCPFWQAVLSEAYGSPARVPIDEVDTLHSSVSRIWNLPELISPVRRARFNVLLERYVSHLERLYDAIRVTSGARTIVDSSKLPSYCYVLSRMEGSSLRLLHLVRDSRAVAFSFMRKRRKPEIHSRDGYMRRFSPFRSSVDWNVLNLGMEWVRAADIPCDRLRYEDLVEDPEGELSQISWLPHGAGDNLLSDRETRLAANHSVAGNPVRFKHALTIRPDTEWKVHMKREHRHLVTALTFPLLARYGYLGPGASREHQA
jgi:hypothetical protein